MLRQLRARRSFTCACSAAWHESVSFVAQAILAQGCERRFGFVAGCVHRMAPAACRPVIKCGTFGCTGTCPLSVVECGYQPGKKPASCRTCGTTFPRPDVTLSDFLPGKRKEKKKNRSQTASHPVPRRSSWVSWSDSPREQTEPDGEDAVMGDCTESHQSEINRKIRANDKLGKILTSMPEEHRALIHGDSFQSKMKSLDDEKAALLAPKDNSFPCNVELRNR